MTSCDPLLPLKMRAAGVSHKVPEIDRGECLPYTLSLLMTSVVWAAHANCRCRFFDKLDVVVVF